MPLNGSPDNGLRTRGGANAGPIKSERELADARPLGTLEKVVVALCLLFGYAIVFFLVDEWNARSPFASTRLINPRTALDAAIPFVPSYIYAYLAYYLWLLIPIPILRTRAQFYRAVYAFALTQMVAVVVYVVFPSQMERPLVVADDLTARLVRFVYEVDRGYNILPSLHVAHSVLVALLFWSLRPKYFLPVALGSGLICASTLFVKQHYLLDLPAGVALAIACYYSTGLIAQRLRPKEPPPEDAAYT